ncbi:MAG: hypothetical protein NUV46_00910 [Nanoarchaeota archaeon]|nr:hypothetical protein [Nanoarchaeota archaeon]
MYLKKKVKGKPIKEKRKVSTKFAGILALISIVGFIEIILTSFFEISITEYSAFLWLTIMGAGLVLASKPKSLYETSKKKFDEGSFSRLTTFVLGLIAIVSAVLSLPFINITHPILFASMGIISIISIIFIVVQTWFIKH